MAITYTTFVVTYRYEGKTYTKEITLTLTNPSNWLLEARIRQETGHEPKILSRRIKKG